MDFIEKTGKTVEDALNDALKELKTTADKVNVEVIEEAKNGIFGLFAKKAKIRVTLKDAAKKIGDIVDETVDSIKEDYKAGKEEAAAARETVKKEEAKPAVREAREYVIEEAAVDAAKEFLQKIFNAMRIEVVMEKFINKNEGVVTFKLHGSDMGILIGKHGQTLDSLQYLTNLVANKNSAERIRIVIDIEDYRERRVETLNRLAQRLADKVKRTGERVVLEPMNPHERKIIHVALQNDRRITTLSEGEEPYRRVVIELKK
ncbi:MAG: protein jag [Phascolarctobacterium sp.]|nr:MAG: protein jag [Phascolarctobacterium sp.]